MNTNVRLETFASQKIGFSVSRTRGWTALLAVCGSLLAACSSSDSNGGTGGSGAGTGGGSNGSGGTTASGGATGTGGTPGTGGASGAPGSGGAPGAGGTTGSGGTTVTDGSAGSAGSAIDAGSGGARPEGGTASDGSANDGAAGSDGALGDGAAANCAGNAISLSANGTAAASDAAHARVMVDLMTDLPIGNANRTLEFWAYIKPTDWAGDVNTLFEYGTQNTVGPANGFGLDFGANAVLNMAGNHATIDPYTNGGFDNDSTAFLGITSTPTQWVHFAMVWNGTSILTYVNGTLRITSNGTGGTTMLATQPTQLTIGCNNPRFACFNGLIDDFRVWNVARAAGDIMANYNRPLLGTEAGLVGYWKFDEAPGAAMAADAVTSSGHTAHPGTPMAVAAGMLPTFVTPPVPAPILCP
jgi:hypothetical protein